MTTCRARFAALALTVGLVAAVTPADAGSPAPLRDIAGSEWGFPGLDKAYVQFGSGGKVMGFGGCNRFRGSYTFRDGALKIGPLMSTRMACPEMAAEARLMRSLDAAAHAEATHLKLVLKDAGGRTLATLTRRDFD
jgi:heat shock protein HslJ